MISYFAILLVMGVVVSQTSNVSTNSTAFKSPIYGDNKCGTVGKNNPLKVTDCSSDLRISTNQCCMLTLLIDGKNFTVCDSIPTWQIIGNTKLKSDVAKDVVSKGFTYVDYDCGLVTARPPQVKQTPDMGSNECGTVGANMPTKLEDCSQDRTFSQNTCCYLKGKYQGDDFTSCSAYANKNPWGEDYKGIVTKVLQPLNITVVDYVCASNYLSVSALILLIISFLF